MSYIKKEYEQSESVKQAQAAYTESLRARPETYRSQYQPQLDVLLGKITARQPFQYDLNADPLYRQYKDQYIRQGRLAMMDTVAQASALTGGYANSYAQTAGQQTYQGYLQGLNDRIPELYALALEGYRAEGDRLANQFDLLSGQEDRAYQQYTDGLSRWDSQTQQLYEQYLQEREFDYTRYADAEAFAYGQHRDGIADSQWQASFDRQKEKDTLAYQQWLQEFEYQQEQDRQAYTQWLQEFQEDRRRYDQEWAAKEAAAAAKTSRGGGSSGGRKTEETVDTQKAQNFVENMLNNATSSKFDPTRVINGTNALTAEEKQEAHSYLKQVLAAGRMK